MDGTGLDIFFKTADKNHDGEIDCTEFKQAPFEFISKPTSRKDEKVSWNCNYYNFELYPC